MPSHRLAPRAIRLAVALAALNMGVAFAADLPTPTGLQAQALAAHGDGTVDDIQLTWTAYAGFPANCTNNREIRILRSDVQDVYNAAAGTATSFLDGNLAEGTYTYALQARCRVPAVPGPGGSPSVNLVSDQSATASAAINNAPACAGAPTVTANATPTTLWPPNGKLVTISVSGAVTPQQNCAMPEYLSFAILDEYAEYDTDLTAEPLTNGTFSFSVQLEASRLGGDADGRQYVITLDTPDGGTDAIDVVVPHDQRKK